MTKYFTILIVLSLFFFNCGKKDNSTSSDIMVRNNTDKKIAKSNNTKYSNYQVDKEGNRLPEIKAVTFTGKPFVNSNIQADVHLSIPSEDLGFQFQWVVNDVVVEGIDSEILPHDKFKQGDWIFCKVKIMNEGYKSNEVKSKYIKILGLTPILNLYPIPEISVPGEFRYRINASLPGQETEENSEDKSEENAFEDFPQDKGLTFTLISPTDKDIFIDPSSGEISWEITESIAASMKGKVEIKFKVTNPDGGSITSSIKLSFKAGGTDNGPSLGNEIE